MSPLELTKPGKKNWLNIVLSTVQPKESETPQLYPEQDGVVLALRKCKPCAVRQAEVFLV